MRTLAKLIVFVICTTFANAQDNNGQSVTVTIDNVVSNTGKVVFSLHTAETFMKGQGIQNVESKIKDGKVSITFKNVIPGEYAILVLHDENENNRMDFELNGMPKENYATSNNAMSFGPPQFGESKFKVTSEDIQLKIRF